MIIINALIYITQKINPIGFVVLKKISFCKIPLSRGFPQIFVFMFSQKKNL